jgi:hypothetical protein
MEQPPPKRLSGPWQAAVVRPPPHPTPRCRRRLGPDSVIHFWPYNHLLVQALLLP